MGGKSAVTDGEREKALLQTWLLLKARWFGMRPARLKCSLIRLINAFSLQTGNHPTGRFAAGEANTKQSWSPQTLSRG